MKGCSKSDWLFYGNILISPPAMEQLSPFDTYHNNRIISITRLDNTD